MKNLDLLSCKWVLVNKRRWLKQPITQTSSYQNVMGEYTFTYYYARSDIEHFVDSLFQEIARKLMVPYEEIEPTLKEQNEFFYYRLEQETLNNILISKATLKELWRFLIVPDVKKLIKKQKSIFSIFHGENS